MRSGLLALVALAALAGCARPLTEAEAGFAGALFGETLDTSRVRVAVGMGLTPPPGPGPLRFRRLETLPEAPCAREKPSPRTGPPAAFVAYNRLHYTSAAYTADSMAGWPERIRMPHALLLAHELTHVWQWQNREITGYHPLRAAGESIRASDPYFYRVEPGRPFLDYGFEQQAALVEDYVCHRFLDPDAPRMDEIRAVLAPVFPLDGLEAALGE